MKVLNKIKSIYLLAIVALLSFCMLLFPAMPKTASADGEMGTGTIEIKSAKVVVQEYAQGVEKWAIMFKAEITQEQYNAITDSDTANVKFGMLIGPTAKLGDATTYEGLVANKFVSISYVGSVAGEGIQAIEFEEGKTTYEYWGSIVYDDASLSDVKDKGDIRLGAASLELTAIPFYADGTIETKALTNEDASVVMAGAKSAVPRNILVESHLLQKDGAAVEDGKAINPETTVKNYAGTLIYDNDNDYYVCRSTNRLMAGAKQGELSATNLMEKATDLAVAGKTRTATTASDLFDAEKLAALPKYGQVNFVDYTADGIKVYQAQVAERVITRFADTTVGTAVVDTTTDYLAQVSSSAYKSIFYCATTFTTASAVYIIPTHKGYDGLYVLGNNISMPSSHSYTVISAGSYNNRIAQRTGTDGSYISAAVYMPPTANGGFNGTFDGRGFKIDVNKQALHGVFPAMYGATIKNVALLNLYTSWEWGGICGSAKKTTFENVYATVTSIGQGTCDNENPIGVALEQCTLNNVVIQASGITNANMTNSPSYGFGYQKEGHGQGKVTSGVFSFVRFPDVYIDASGTYHFSANTSLSTDWDPFINNGASEYLGREITKSNVVTTRMFAYGVDEKDPFRGTTATNVYAVGNSPLFINYQLAVANDPKIAGETLYYQNMASCEPTNKAVVFVNDTLQFNSQILDAETGVPTGQTEVLNTNTTDFYKISSLIDTNGLFTVDANDGIWTLAEIIRKGKEYRCGRSKVANLLANPETSEFEVRLITNPGFHDVANTTEMKAHVLAQETPFDSAYWNVGADGSVSWAK